MAQTLAQLVKAKYPGVYDDMDDSDLEQRVRSKYPGAYDDLPLTGGSKVKPIPPGAKPPGMLEKAGDFALGAAKGYGESMVNAYAPLMGPLGMVTPDAVTRALTPTDAEKPGYYTEGVAEMVVPGARAAGAAKAAAPSIGRRIFSAATSPVGAGAIGAAGALAAGRSPLEALGAGVAMGAGAKKLPGVVTAAGKALGAEARTAGPRVARKAAEKAVEGATKATAKAGPVAVEKAAKVAAPVVSRGAEVASKHNSLMQFAKKIAAENPKVGEKIWLLLDEAGAPVKMLTSTEAGAAARKGLRTTWVKNLWK